MANPARFEVVPDDPPTEPESDNRAIDFLLFLLKPLSQKTVIALGNLFSLLTVISVFWLAYGILPAAPTNQQLIGLGGYAVFVSVINWIVRRK